MKTTFPFAKFSIPLAVLLPPSPRRPVARAGHARLVKSKQRTNLVQGRAAVNAKDKIHRSATLKPLPPGEYVIDYRVLARDSHSAPSRILFRVLAPK